MYVYLYTTRQQGAAAAAAGKSDGPAARLLIAARTLLLDADVAGPGRRPAREETANVASERGGGGEGWSDGALLAAGWPFFFFISLKPRVE